MATAGAGTGIGSVLEGAAGGVGGTVVIIPGWTGTVGSGAGACWHPAATAASHHHTNARHVYLRRTTIVL
jgi:hypothetical protein